MFGIGKNKKLEENFIKLNQKLEETKFKLAHIKSDFVNTEEESEVLQRIAAIPNIIRYLDTLIHFTMVKKSQCSEEAPKYLNRYAGAIDAYRQFKNSLLEFKKKSED
jgi:hypothetical protein